MKLRVRSYCASKKEKMYNIVFNKSRMSTKCLLLQVLRQPYSPSRDKLSALFTTAQGFQAKGCLE